MLNYVALGLLIFVFVFVFYAVIIVHDIPTRLRRNANIRTRTPSMWLAWSAS